MNRTKRSIKKAVISIIIVIIVAVACFLALVFSNSSYSAKQYKFSNNIFDKIIEAQKAGTTVSFNTEELNESIAPFIKDNMTSGDAVVRGVNAEIKDSTLKFYIPASYKNFKFLLTTEGKVSYNNSNIVYDPVYFKIGKISIPKSYVINELSGRLGDSVRIQDNKVNVSSELLPIKIKSIDIKGGRLNIHTDTTSMTIQERLNWFNNVVKQSGNAGTLNKFIEKFMDGSSISSVIKSNNSTNSNAGTSSLDSASAGNTTSGNTQPGSAKKGGSTSENSTGGADEVISEISSAISNRDESKAGSIEAKYNKLSHEEQEKVRSTLNSMVGSGNMNKIMEQLNK
ncbi:hypothetical protein [Clostridium tyrobutyricum]|uniref:hypothetical protein n=1 Tax=Clostridium tyrobutyricum TaxID=1519 RepID=UPI00057D72E7|nr:hypothetical protein [Clostridium tyrobutyricum]QCH26539.1 hypothetical protein EZN00_00128 [Clostridium tyrobutyricum]